MATNKHENITVQGGSVSLGNFCHDLLATIRSRSRRLKRRHGGDTETGIFAEFPIIRTRDIVAGLWTAVCDRLKKLVRRKPKADRSPIVDEESVPRYVRGAIAPEHTGNRMQRRDDRFRGGRSLEEIRPYDPATGYYDGGNAVSCARRASRYRPRGRESK